MRSVNAEKELMTQEEAEKATAQKNPEFIFLTGFSSAEAVSGISGRGVGMDALRQTSMDLGGKVAVQSVPTVGTTLTISPPLPGCA